MRMHRFCSHLKYDHMRWCRGSERRADWENHMKESIEARVLSLMYGVAAAAGALEVAIKLFFVYQCNWLLCGAQSVDIADAVAVACFSLFFAIVIALWNRPIMRLLQFVGLDQTANKHTSTNTKTDKSKSRWLNKQPAIRCSGLVGCLSVCLFVCLFICLLFCSARVNESFTKRESLQQSRH